MVKLIRLSGDAHDKYEILMSLYMYAFPEEERRDMDVLHSLIQSEKRMCFCVIEHDSVAAGLLVYWDFDDFVFLEHFAVFESMRGKNIGGMLLEYVNKTFGKDIILEVEHPETEIAARRIGFYKRHGYRVVDMIYAQPSYREKGVHYPMLLMSTNVGMPLDVMGKRVEIIKREAYSV